MFATSSGTPVRVRRNRQARHIKLYITSKREVRLTLPWYVPLSAGRAVVRAKEQWIENALANLPAVYAPTESQRETALARTTALAEEYAVKYGVHFRHIRIGDQSTRWGSCSRSGTLSFNWRLALLPENICRYVVIHELCHLREMNHSPRFWRLVAAHCPDYKACRRWLRDEKGALF